MKQINYRTNKKNAVITGMFFILATAAAIAGMKLYDPILAQPNYIQKASNHATQIVWGAFFELILVCSVSGTAIMLFPYLRQYNKHLGLGYFCFRVLEAVFILIGIVAMLSVLTLSTAYVNDGSSNPVPYQAAGIVAKALHDWTFILGPLFMLGINTFIYSYVFFRTWFVPRKLALTGMIGAILVFISALLVMFGIILQPSTIQILLAMPIAVYEMVLAGWFITKGFNLTYLKPNLS